MDIPHIVLLGLGPGEADLMTRQAWRILNEVSEVYLRTGQHPTVAEFPKHLAVHTFDDLYESGENFEQVYSQIVEQVLRLGRRPQGVVYAVPGHPFVAEATCPEIARRARLEGLKVEVIEGISFLEPTFTALGLDPTSNLTIQDALELIPRLVPSFPPDTDVLIAQIHSQYVASELKLLLMDRYPDEHPVKLLHAMGTQSAVLEELALHEIDRSQHIGIMTTLYVPALDSAASLEAFQEVIARLRAPDGCPWDKEQTHQSLRAGLLEETYEAVDALDAEDADALCEELGDLLLHIVMQAQIANELGEFNMADVLSGIHEKIVRRHPHVFGDLEMEDAQGVLLKWEQLKMEERHANGQPSRGVLDGVSRSLPALLQAYEYQNRVSRFGIDRLTAEKDFDKLVERLQKSSAAKERGAPSKEIGDFLFALVALSRLYQVDPESALRQANERFRKRIDKFETAARLQGKSLSELSLQECKILWSQID